MNKATLKDERQIETDEVVAHQLVVFRIKVFR